MAPTMMTVERQGISPHGTPVQRTRRSSSRDRLLSALVPKDNRSQAEREEADLTAKLRNELLDSLSEEAVLEATIAQKRSHAVMQGSWIETLKKRVETLQTPQQPPKNEAAPEIGRGFRKGAAYPTSPPEPAQLAWELGQVNSPTKNGIDLMDQLGDSATFPETAGWEENINAVEGDDEDMDIEEFSLEAAKAQIANLKDLRRQVATLEDELANRIAEIAELGSQLHEFRAYATELREGSKPAERSYSRRSA